MWVVTHNFTKGRNQIAELFLIKKKKKKTQLQKAQRKKPILTIILTFKTINKNSTRFVD